MSSPLRVLGIDPGLTRTGWGVVEARGSKLAHVAHGTIAPKGEDLARRLVMLREALAAMIEAHCPDLAAVEYTVVNADGMGTLKLAHARAIAMLAPAEAGLPVAEYSPTAVKKAIVGAGRADKKQVAHMVSMLLPGSNATQADAVDALAIAICHAHRAPTLTRLAEVTAG